MNDLGALMDPGVVVGNLYDRPKIVQTISKFSHLIGGGETGSK